MYQCKYCLKNITINSHKIHEMMFGFRDEFEYLECANCGSIQIASVPAELAKYYPTDYLSLELKSENRLKTWLKLKRFDNTYSKRGFLGKIINKIWWAPRIGEFLRIANVKLDDSILDVGSGEGELLYLMHKYGFSNLEGVDPFISSNKNLCAGLNLINGNIHQLSKKYDLIMFNHSLEHVDNPQKDLLKAALLLNPGKYVILRIPVMGGFAWRKYGTDWVQLDAPRHLSIPTVKGVIDIAAQSGFKLDQMIYESWEFQFWGSEQFQNDIPLHDSKSLWMKSKESMFSKKQLKDFKRKAAKLNKENDGDMACFFLRKM